MKHLLISAQLLIFVFVAKAQRSEIFAPDGKAIKGYDAVAFFKESKPVQGIDSLTYLYKNAQWSFSSRENLEAFKAMPEQYVPQFGGYCAYGTAEGHKAPTDAATWSIVDGKLYFNYNRKVKSLWLKDQQSLIKKGDANWPIIMHKE